MTSTIPVCRPRGAGTRACRVGTPAGTGERSSPWRPITAVVSLAGSIWMAAAICAPSAQAQTYTVLYRFKGGTTDGENPQGGLALDKSGNLYGTTVFGTG